MNNFAEQCLELAHSILVHNLPAFEPEQGQFKPFDGERLSRDEAAHTVFALGEYYRATQSIKIEYQGQSWDLIDVAARCVTAQVMNESLNEKEFAYLALGLLAFGPSRERNAVFSRLTDETVERLGQVLSAGERKPESGDSFVYAISKAVARFSLGFVRKDETTALIKDFFQYIKQTSAVNSGGYIDNAVDKNRPGVFDSTGVANFTLLRQALQLHTNMSVKETMLPALRSYVDSYLKLLVHLVRQDGLSWSFGRHVGAYPQMYSISMVLQAFRDEWINRDKAPTYHVLLRKLFQFFFMTYIDQGEGYLKLRDQERMLDANLTTRMANLDAVRCLSQWSRLSRNFVVSELMQEAPERSGGRFICFDKNKQKEQGVFIYKDIESGLHVQLPLLQALKPEQSAHSLAFPHCPGIFDWPEEVFMPVMVPALYFGSQIITPSFYGKNCVTGMAPRGGYSFAYDQPELMNQRGERVPGLGSCKVRWTFEGSKIECDFQFKVNKAETLTRMCLQIPIGAAHSVYCAAGSLMHGEEGLRPEVIKDDFRAEWATPKEVSADPLMRSFYGKIHYLQTLERSNPLSMQPGLSYQLSLQFHPHIVKL